MARSQIKDKRKIQLIQATMDSIAKRGLTETTITHISKGASMSRGIINFYFTSKEIMMREVLAHLIAQYEDVWQSDLAKAPVAPRAKLEAIVKAHYDKQVCSSKRLNVMSAFWGHAASHEAYREKIDASDQRLLETIAKLWREIAPKGYDAVQFSRQLHALIRGLWLSYLLAPKTTDRNELAGQCMAFIDQHITPIRVVKDTPAPKADMYEVKKSAKPKKAKVENVQMDIEDLFAVASR